MKRAKQILRFASLPSRQTAQSLSIYFRVSISIEECTAAASTENAPQVVHSGHCERPDVTGAHLCLLITSVSVFTEGAHRPPAALKPADTKGRPHPESVLPFSRLNVAGRDLPLKGKAQHALPILGGSAVDEAGDLFF